MSIDIIKGLINENKMEEALYSLLQLDGHELLKMQCLFELNRYDECKVFFEDKKDFIEGDYYELLGFYILSLIQLSEYDLALGILNEESSMPYIESPYQDVLNNLYNDVVAQKQLYFIENDLYQDHLSVEQVITILDNETDFDLLLSTVLRLDDYNIRSFMDTIKKFLVNINKSLIIKSFILELLVKQQISEVVLVTKNGYEYEFLPTANQLVKQSVYFHNTSHLLEERLSKQPSYLQMSLEVLDLYSYIIYPDSIDESECNIIASLCEYYIFSINFEEVDASFYKFYDITEAEIINRVDEFIKLIKQE